MKKRIIISCCLLLAFSFCFSVVLKNNGKTSITVASANNDTFALGDLVSSFMGSETNNAIENAIDGITMDKGVGSKISNVVGEIADGITGVDVGGIIDGIGNIGGGLIGGIGGSGKNDTPVQQSTYEIQTIIPMITAEQTTAAPPVIVQPETQQTDVQTVTEESTTHGLTIDASVSEVPYEKPSDTINPGDEGDAVRWLQWIFIYSDYGLRPDGITGVMDDDTVALVKKLQQENGLKVDGVVTPEVIDKAELLYLSKNLGEDNTGQYIQPSVTIENENNISTDTEDSNSKLVKIIIVIAVIWIVALGVMAFIFFTKKKKTEKAVEKLEATENKQKSKQPEKKSEKNISGMSDLFDEANSKNK